MEWKRKNKKIYRLALPDQQWNPTAFYTIKGGWMVGWTDHHNLFERWIDPGGFSVGWTGGQRHYY